MALRFVDGCDSYSSTDGSDIGTKWDAVTNAGTCVTYAATGGRTGAGAITFLDSSGSIAAYALTQNEASDGNDFAVGFWFRAGGTPASEIDLLHFEPYQTASSPFMLRLATNGTLNFDRANIGGIQAANIPNSFVCDDLWHWIEIRATVNTSGSLYVHIDGQERYSNASLTTSQSGSVSIERIQFLASSSQNTTIYIDDIIFYDDSTGVAGGDLRSSVDYPIGPIVIETLRPNSTGANQDFTGVGGSTTNNYLNVDETVPDDDTSYNVLDSTGVDTFGFTSLTSTDVSQIKGVAVTVRARTDGLNQTYHRAVAISSASTSNNISFNTGGSYARWQSAFIHDPQSSTRWTTASLDAAEFGYAFSTST